jgi:NOL1/NOP2/sun family putative RNA methylase
MQRLLGGEYASFLASYEKEHFSALRLNTLKVNAEDFGKINPFQLRAVPWAEAAYYYDGSERPGKHPYYYAGLYYIQEPSAMAPVELLDVRPGDRVLDLCAAPGGKSTQIAAKLKQSGVLVANDPHPDRAKVLAKNIERAGIRNAVVLNDQPEALAKAFPRYFTKILVDAPCSGEGMFRKDEEMARHWDEQAPGRYAELQKRILREAVQMLAPGGTLVYSTCTFSPEENEGVVAEFVHAHPWMEVVPAGEAFGFAPGRPDWLEEIANAAALPEPEKEAVAQTWRLWPHLVQGEGHYAAVLRRREQPGGVSANEGQEANKAWGETGKRPGGKGRNRLESDDVVRGFAQFVREHLVSFPEGEPVLLGPHLYLTRPDVPPLHGVHPVRPGWYVGSGNRGRFTPSQALAMGLTKREALRSLSLTEEEAVRYLKGETLDIPEQRIELQSPDLLPKGYVLVCIGPFPLGWGKWLEGRLKNEYPPGWRWT